jgi:hypothetical protein
MQMVYVSIESTINLLNDDCYARTSQVSADVDESNTNSEVTIGFGNVTNDTMEFTMDTSVDVYYSK